MKNTFKSLVIAGALALPLVAHGGELFKTVLLPDDGMGSSSTGFMDYTDDACMQSFGRKIDPFGKEIPMVWSVGYDGTVLSATALPLPAGFEGGCQKGGILSNGRPVALGTLTDASGNRRAALWRRNAVGVWGQAQLLSSSFPQSFFTDASGAFPALADGSLVTVYSRQNASGVWRPAILVIGASSQTTSALPASSTRDYFASWLAMEPGGEGLEARVVGSGENASGVLKSFIWTIGSDGTPSQPTSIPAGGTASSAMKFELSGGTGDADMYVVGTRTKSNGLNEGYFYTNSPGGGLLGLKPLSGFTDAAAYSLGDTGTHEVGHIVAGQSYNPGGEPTATMWATFPSSFYPSQQRCQDPSGMTNCSSFMLDLDFQKQGIAAGTVRNLIGNDQAAMFFATETQVPDAVNVLTGTQVGANHAWGRAFPLWHDDAAELKVKTVLVGSSREAVLEIIRVPLYKGNVASDWDFNFTIRASALKPTGTDASGTLTVEAYNHVSGIYEGWGDYGMTGANATITGTRIEDALHRYHDAAGLVKFRLRFVQNGGGTVHFGVGQFTSDDDPDHY